MNRDVQNDVPSLEERLFEGHLRRHLSPIGAYLDDPRISEILINGPSEIFVERGGCLERVESTFEDDLALRALARAIAQFVGRIIDDQQPRLDARLPDGSRVHAVLAPPSRQGTTIAIRKFFLEKITMEELVGFGSLSEPLAGFLRDLVRGGVNIMVSGGTGSGKTTLLNVFSECIPGKQRILVLEDSSELRLARSHVLYYESRPPDRAGRGRVTIRDLLHSALRLRPDRIVIGEVRGEEALDLVQALITGHAGSMGTIHANHPVDALYRLETLAQMGEAQIPSSAMRAMVKDAIGVVVQVQRFADGTRKITQVAEVDRADHGGGFRTRDLWRFVRKGTGEGGRVTGRFEPTGELPSFREQLEAAGLPLPPAMLAAAERRRHHEG